MKVSKLARMIESSAFGELHNTATDRMLRLFRTSTGRIRTRIIYPYISIYVSWIDGSVRASTTPGSVYDLTTLYEWTIEGLYSKQNIKNTKYVRNTRHHIFFSRRIYNAQTIYIKHASKKLIDQAYDLGDDTIVSVNYDKKFACVLFIKLLARSNPKHAREWLRIMSLY